MNNSLCFRKDNRSEEVFASNIHDYTQRESIYGECLRIEFENRMKVKVMLNENGIDNLGNLIENNLNNHNVDKKYLIDGKEELIEIKTAPEFLNNFYSFKVFSIKKVCEQNAKVALTKCKEYFIFGKGSLEWMLENLPHKIYSGFSPNDIAVRIYKDQINDLINKKLVIHKEWCEDSMKNIEKHKFILTREKQKI